MPIKLIGTVLVVAIVGIFCGFNMGEEFRCSINLIFYKTPQIPVFLTIICSFVVGILVMTPFTMKKQKSTEEKKVSPDSESNADSSIDDSTKIVEP